MTATVEDTRRFNIFELRRFGALIPGAIRLWHWRSARNGVTRFVFLKAAKSEIRVIFRHRGNWQKQLIPLVRTGCHLGGSRLWFRCGCGRRVGVLFDGGGGFYCRTCLKLRYSSQLVTKHWRSIDRAQTIRVRLGGSANILEPFPERPRYMRIKKYESLRKRALASQADGLLILDRSLDRRFRRN